MKTVTMTTQEWSQIVTILKNHATAQAIELHDKLWEQLLGAPSK